MLSAFYIWCHMSPPAFASASVREDGCFAEIARVSWRFVELDGMDLENGFPGSARLPRFGTRWRRLLALQPLITIAI